jgi:hypothetical protein
MSRHILSPTLAATAGSAAFVLALLAGRPDAAADDSRPKPKRQPWISSKITGSPEPPPPFRSVRVFPEVQFNHPLLIARCPGTDRLFVGEQEGVIYSIANVPGAKKELFFDLRKEVKTIGKLPGAKDIGELYGLVFPPEVRGEPLLLRVLHAAAEGAKGGAIRGRHARVAVHGDQD